MRRQNNALNPGNFVLSGRAMPTPAAGGAYDPSEPFRAGEAPRVGRPRCLGSSLHLVTWSISWTAAEGSGGERRQGGRRLKVALPAGPRERRCLGASFALLRTCLPGPTLVLSRGSVAGPVSAAVLARSHDAHRLFVGQRRLPFRIQQMARGSLCCWPFYKYFPASTSALQNISHSFSRLFTRHA